MNKGNWHQAASSGATQVILNKMPRQTGHFNWQLAIFIANELVILPYRSDGLITSVHAAPLRIWQIHGSWWF